MAALAAALAGGDLELPSEAGGPRVVARRDTALSTFFVEVRERRLRVRCGGAGGPGVLLVHGAGTRLETWREILPELARSGRTCAYDRPGHGESEPLAGDRTPADLVDEIGGVAREAGIDTPFVLVGHSLGGLYARLYAVSRPGHVAALVLVDPTHEEMHARVRGAVPEEFWRRWGESRRRNDDAVNELEIARILGEKPMPDVPVRVITAGVRRSAREGYDPVVLDSVARELHADLLRGVSDGRHVVAEGSGHDVQFDRPDVVVRAVREAASSLRP